jgi:hypothetical protein
MKISEDTERVLKYLDEYTGEKLRKRNDLGTILELGASHGLAEQINFLIFRGKSVWNISKKMWKVSPDDEGAQLLQKEMVRAVEEIKDVFEDIIGYAEDEDIKRFNDIYMPATRGALKNVVDICHDFAQLKNLQSDSIQSKKQNKENEDGE